MCTEEAIHLALQLTSIQSTHAASCLFLPFCSMIGINWVQYHLMGHNYLP